MHKLTAKICQQYIWSGRELASERPLEEFEIMALQAFEIALNTLVFRESLPARCAMVVDSASPYAEGSAREMRDSL